MTVRTGFYALSILALVTLLVLILDEDRWGPEVVEAYRWVYLSGGAAIVVAICAIIGLIAGGATLFRLGYLAGAIALIAAFVQLIQLSDGGIIGGTGSTFTMFLTLGLGYLGLAFAADMAAEEGHPAED